MIKKLLMMMLVVSPMAVLAQGVEMADQFRADGKIYVVIAVFSVLLAGFFLYLFMVDKKIAKWEKEVKSPENEPSKRTTG